MISVLLTALAWLVITLLCAGVLFACGRLFFWRQVASPGALFVALALVMFGVSNLLESRPLGPWPSLASIPVPTLPLLFLVSTPVRALFFLYFCVFPEGRLVWRVTRRPRRCQGHVSASLAATTPARPYRPSSDND